ncbi:M13-type metalloendopeptidase, partial [Bifidobacterium catenulatum]
IDQYNAFVPTQLAEKYADDPTQAPHVNGALTIGENIGDLSGVNIALKAYSFALDETAGREKNGSMDAIEDSLAEAPQIDGFTGLQRFFLSYASIWRTKNRDELAEQYLQIDPHSPAECRTNGIARNVDLFYKAFDVKPEDGMWLDPDQRVRIW